MQTGPHTPTESDASTESHASTRPHTPRRRSSKGSVKERSKDDIRENSMPRSRSFTIEKDDRISQSLSSSNPSVPIKEKNSGSYAIASPAPLSQNLTALLSIRVPKSTKDDSKEAKNSKDLKDQSALKSEKETKAAEKSLQEEITKHRKKVQKRGKELLQKIVKIAENLKLFQMTSETKQSTLDEALKTLCNPLFSKKGISIEVMVGLTAKYTFKEILNSFVSLFPLFSLNEKSNALYLLTQFIMLDRFNNDFAPNDCKSKILKLCELEYQPLRESFKELLESKNAMILSQQKSKFQLKPSKKTFSDLYPDADELDTKRLEEKATEIAEDLRTHSLTFYRDFTSQEIRKVVCEKADQEDKKEKLSIMSQEMANAGKITALFVRKILEAKTEEHRLLYIKLILHILERLQHSPRDFNSSMPLLLALQNHSVDRLNLTSKLESKYQEMLNGFASLLDSGRNFDLLRATTTANPEAIPYLGIIAKDIALAKAGNEGKIALSELMGKFLIPFFVRLDKLKEIKLKNASSLETVLPKMFLLENYEKAFEHLSFAIRPKGEVATGDSLSIEARSLENLSPTVTPGFNSTRSSLTGVDEMAVTPPVGLAARPLLDLTKKDDRRKRP